MRRPLHLILLAGFLLSATPAFAQDEISRPLQSTEQYRFDSGGNVTAKWGPSLLIGEYQGTLLSDPTHPTITLYCVDFVHSIGTGNVVNVNTTGVGDPSPDLGLTRLGNATESLMQYQQAAYLASMFTAYADYASVAFDSNLDGVVDGSDATFGSYAGANAKRNAWSGIHAAIWSIMTPGFPYDPVAVAPDGAYIQDVGLAMAMAQPFMDLASAAKEAGFGGFDFTEWSILTDVNYETGGKQEFLVRTALATPEPATVVLLLSGMLLLFGVGRRRFAELGED